MSLEKTAHPTAPVEPAGEEDWGEDWGDVTAPTPDINQELEKYITELVVSATPSKFHYALLAHLCAANSFDAISTKAEAALGRLRSLR
jgi:hypothetical protein